MKSDAADARTTVAILTQLHQQVELLANDAETVRARRAALMARGANVAESMNGSATRDQGYSANSVRIMRTVLRKALSQAEREGLLVRNAAALSTAPKVRAEPGQAFSVEQARLLFRQLEGHRHEALAQLMLTYGLRRGEALRAQLVDLDLDDAQLGLRAGVKRVRRRDGEGDRKTRVVVGDLKTARSRRTLFLTPPLVASLRWLLARQAKERLAAGAAWTDHGLLFPSQIGAPLDPDNFSHWFTDSMSRRACATGTLTTSDTPAHP
jgi:integrase